MPKREVEVGPKKRPNPVVVVPLKKPLAADAVMLPAKRSHSIGKLYPYLKVTGCLYVCPGKVYNYFGGGL